MRIDLLTWETSMELMNETLAHGLPCDAARQFRKRRNIDGKWHVIVPSDKKREDDVNHGRHKNGHWHIPRDLLSRHPQPQLRQNEGGQRRNTVVDRPRQIWKEGVRVPREDHPYRNDNDRQHHK